MNVTLLQRLLTTENTSSAIPLRLVLAIIFTVHGAQKLFGWFGGYGLEATGQWMESIGLVPGLAMAALSGSVEFFGGILLLVGLFARPIALMLSVTMLVAIVTVHLEDGLFVSNNGAEFALALFAMTVSLVIQGAGSYSLDQKLSARQLFS